MGGRVSHGTHRQRRQHFLLSGEYSLTNAKAFRQHRWGIRFLNRAPEEFAAELARFLAELNAIHPFREGNGWAQLSCAGLIGETFDHPLRLEAIDPRTFLSAMLAGFAGDLKPLTEAVFLLLRSPRVARPKKKGPAEERIGRSRGSGYRIRERVRRMWIFGPGKLHFVPDFARFSAIFDPGGRPLPRGKISMESKTAKAWISGDFDARSDSRQGSNFPQFSPQTDRSFMATKEVTPTQGSNPNQT